ncbi:hypothetical protein RCL_jg27792.t1 [Rhizophagus clarus]|uniref:Uncharacterized protein n=1 Tax=Rhizophagus clarus TaxID=94130 RepID=A0A8H3L9X2_9GLOM|nr:hypothetical protein RCL_jg27792.t1 [Rhizophagus clarus]
MVVDVVKRCGDMDKAYKFCYLIYFCNFYQRIASFATHHIHYRTNCKFKDPGNVLLSKVAGNIERVS